MGRAVAIALLLCGGCSALVSGENASPACDATDGDPCPAGTSCVDNVCVSTHCSDTDPCNGRDDDCDGTIDEGSMTMPACPSGTCVAGTCNANCHPEICDGVDNDCDDRIDEGLAVDGDGDTYLACNPSMPSQQDCDDTNPAVHPGAREICDGIDNDCNGATQESASGVCATNEVCHQATGAPAPSCVNLADCMQLVMCSGGQVCDASTSRCCSTSTAGCMSLTDCRVSACTGGNVCLDDGHGAYACDVPRALGAQCVADDDCGSGRCYRYAALGLTAPTGTDFVGVCSQACCDDTDCSSGNGAVCWAPGTGARACVLPSLLGASVPAYTVCNRYQDCGSTHYCAARSVPTPMGTGVSFTCGPHPGSQQVTCSVDSDCETGLCRGGLCIYPCANDGDCSAISDVFCLTGPMGCVSYLVGSDRVGACQCRFSGSDGAAGATCSVNGNCLDGYCNSTLHQCAAYCCHDADCGSGSVCSPVTIGTGYAMVCMPRVSGPS